MKRVQLRRAKGWRMPADTVKVDRSTTWGNPFVIGKHGTRADCILMLKHLLAGRLCLSNGPDPLEQKAYLEFVASNIAALRGKHLACWCPLSAPCHADLLLELANQ